MYQKINSKKHNVLSTCLLMFTLFLVIWEPFGHHWGSHLGTLGGDWGGIGPSFALSWPLFGPRWPLLSLSWAILVPPGLILEPGGTNFEPRGSILRAIWALFSSFQTIKHFTNLPVIIAKTQPFNDPIIFHLPKPGGMRGAIKSAALLAAPAAC